MRPWLKRTLVGVFGVTALIGGLAACSHQMRAHGGPGMTEADRAKWRDHIVDRASRKLDLDAAQKSKLAALADTLAAQRKTMMGEAGGDPHAELVATLAGEHLDRARAQALVDAKTAALREAAPAVIAAAADFFDSLKPEQQQRVRDFLSSRGRRHGWEH